MALAAIGTLASIGTGLYSAYSSGNKSSSSKTTNSYYTDLYNKASTAYDDLLTRVTDRLSSLSDQQTANVVKNYKALWGQSYKGLVDRGMTGSTVLFDTRRGIVRERQSALNDVTDAITEAYNEADTSITQNKWSALTDIAKTTASSTTNSSTSDSSGLYNSLSKLLTNLTSSSLSDSDTAELEDTISQINDKGSWTLSGTDDTLTDFNSIFQSAGPLY